LSYLTSLALIRLLLELNAYSPFKAVALLKPNSLAMAGGNVMSSSMNNVGPSSGGLARKATVRFPSAFAERVARTALSLRDDSPTTTSQMPTPLQLFFFLPKWAVTTRPGAVDAVRLFFIFP